jgi:hypothetical protein
VAGLIGICCNLIGNHHSNYSLPSEKLDVAALRAATLILGFIWLFLWWEGSSYAQLLKSKKRVAEHSFATLFLGLFLN